MSAQPLNSLIHIYRTVRTQRKDLRYSNVEAIIKRLNPLITIVPGHEILTGVLHRDTTFAGNTSPYMGEARFNAGRGFPIVIGVKPEISFKNAQENLANVDFAFQIGRDMFLQNTTAGLTGDEFGDAQDLVAANN